MTPENVGIVSPVDSAIVVRQNVGPWKVVFRWPQGADQGGPMRMEIQPNPDATADELAAGLSSTVLRQIDFQAAAEEWRKLQPHAEKVTARRMERRSEKLRALVSQGLTDEYLAHLAEAYVYLVRTGERSVAGKLAEMTGKSPDTVKQHLKRVRKAEMLTTVSGKAGGQLTDRAADLLGVNRRRKLG